MSSGIMEFTFAIPTWTKPLLRLLQVWVFIWFLCGSDNSTTPSFQCWLSYRQVSNIRRTLVGNKIVDHPDVVGASPVGAAPTTSSFST